LPMEKKPIQPSNPFGRRAEPSSEVLTE
jgi:hypothetical protein